MEKWLVAAKKADFQEWSRKFNIDPVLARIIRNRDVTEEGEVRKFLFGTLEDCHSPWLLYGMEQHYSRHSYRTCGYIDASFNNSCC